MSELTPRQAKLKEKLETFCDRVMCWPLPLKIEEIWGFGSFFRLKDIPTDIDLVLKYSTRNPSYETFESILHKSLKLVSTIESPKEAFTHVAKQELAKGEFDTLMPAFTQWIERFTWDIIFGGIMSIPQAAINEETITKRVLVHELKGLQIFKIVSMQQSLDWLNAESIHKVWDRAYPDAPANLGAILSPETVRATRIKEARNFARQISSHRQEYDILAMLISHIRALKSASAGRENFEKILSKKTAEKHPDMPKKTTDQIIRNITLARPNERAIPPLETPDEYQALSDPKIKECVEKKRLELKCVYKSVIVARKTLHHLYDLKSTPKTERLQKFGDDELTAWRVISDIPKKQVDEDAIRKTLRELRFPEEKVLERKGRGRYRYFIPATEKERLDAIRWNEKSDAEAKYRRMLRPAATGFGRHVSFLVNLDRKLNPASVDLSFYHYCHGEEIPESVNKEVEFLKGRGFAVDRGRSHVYAKLTIELAECNTNKGMREKIRNALRR